MCEKAVLDELKIIYDSIKRELQFAEGKNIAIMVIYTAFLIL